MRQNLRGASSSNLWEQSSLINYLFFIGMGSRRGKDVLTFAMMLILRGCPIMGYAGRLPSYSMLHIGLEASHTLLLWPVDEIVKNRSIESRTRSRAYFAISW